MLLLAACAGGSGEEDIEANATLSNDELVKQAVANMKELESYHFEFRSSGSPSDNIKMSPNLSIVGDMQFNGKGSRVKFRDEAATPTNLSSGPNPDSVVLDVGSGADMLLVEGQRSYQSVDGGKTWRQWGVDTPEDWLLAWFGFMWDPKEGMNGLSSGELTLQDATFRDGDPLIEQVDGVTTRHVVAEIEGDFGTTTVDLWISTDTTPLIRQMRMTGKSVDPNDPKNEAAGPAFINSLVFSPDGRWLVVGGANHVIKLWDLSAPNSAPRKLHPEYATSSGDSRSNVVFSPDGKTLAESTGNKSEVRLWSTSNLDAQPAVLPISGTASSLAVRPDGEMLVAATDDQFYLWDLRELRELQEMPLGNAEPTPTVLPHPTSPLLNYTRVAFSPDGKLLATVNGDNFVRIYDVQNLQATPTTVLSYTDEVLLTNVAFSPDGHLLAAAGWTYSPTLAIWDLRQPQPTPTSIKGIGWVAFSPDGQTLASLLDNQIDLLDVAGLDAPAQVISDTYPGPVTIAFSPDSAKLAAGYRNGKVRIYDLRNPEARPVALIEKRKVDQSGGKPYIFTWKWSRFNEDFGEVKVPGKETIRNR